MCQNHAMFIDGLDFGQAWTWVVLSKVKTPKGGECHDRYDRGRSACEGLRRKARC